LIRVKIKPGMIFNRRGFLAAKRAFTSIKSAVISTGSMFERVKGEL
jgi:hypothetical protein